ncbi:hypothetical protein [Paenibacillus oleatilyticus]|uniref:Uncharacterized protein n=1 Tax=Paenibacillus oleatilyticus TaxID=2594886 RepID=A0ABV4USG2_9BACL
MHYYVDLVREHADPIHFRIEENGKSIGKIKTDGKLIDGRLKKKVTELLKDKSVIGKMRRAEKRIENYIRKVAGSMVGGRPFKPRARGPKGECPK